jgi:hypothetical protein
VKTVRTLPLQQLLVFAADRERCVTSDISANTLPSLSRAKVIHSLARQLRDHMRLNPKAHALSPCSSRCTAPNRDLVVRIEGGAETRPAPGMSSIRRTPPQSKKLSLRPASKHCRMHNVAIELKRAANRGRVIATGRSGSSEPWQFSARCNFVSYAQ